MKTKWLILQVHCGQLQQCMPKNWYGLHVMLVRWCICHFQIAQLQQKRSSTNSVNFHIYISVSLPSKQISQWSWAQALRQWHLWHCTQLNRVNFSLCSVVCTFLCWHRSFCSDASFLMLNVCGAKKVLCNGAALQSWLEHRVTAGYKKLCHVCLRFSTLWSVRNWLKLFNVTARNLLVKTVQHRSKKSSREHLLG